MLPLLFLNKAGRSANAPLLARAAGALHSRAAHLGRIAEQQTQGVCDQAPQAYAPLVFALRKPDTAQILVNIRFANIG